MYRKIWKVCIIMMTCDCKNEIQEIDEFIKSSGYINRRNVENSGIVYIE